MLSQLSHKVKPISDLSLDGFNLATGITGRKLAVGEEQFSTSVMR